MLLKHIIVSDSALAQMSISSPVPSLTFLTLCHVLSNAADMLRVRMREEALVLVPSFARAVDCVAGQRRRHRVRSCYLRPCLRPTDILLNKCSVK